MGTEKPTRRSVALSGLAFVGGCFAGLDMRVLLARAASQRKPLLSAGTLTTMMRGADRAKFYAELANEPGTGLVGFLSRHFTLTDRQIAEIRTIPPEQVSKLKTAARKAVKRAMDEARKAKEEADKVEDSASFGPKFVRMTSRTATRLNLDASFEQGKLSVRVAVFTK